MPLLRRLVLTIVFHRPSGLLRSSSSQIITLKFEKAAAKVYSTTWNDTPPDVERAFHDEK
jgi:hypothetical protein